ncbi:MAG: hydrogenase, partial [Gemmatimonadetes bacterium]|nr:hydrogenase [Gemmatimonadota bacterium]
MGIYGIMRVLLLMGTAPVWSGWFLLSVGAASGVLGAIWALAQHDLKRLLAYHSVENIGIILMGLGAGVLGIAYAHPVVAVLGFAGATLHTLNHALFKSLLFLGAGSVIHATGTREIDRLGGLWKQMPQTATAFLIGSAAIVGLPPLNGFVSEWLVFRSLLATGVAPDASRLAVLAAAALALIGALALACFAKVVGVMYLGTSRERLPEEVHESAPGMVLPLFALAGACTAIGLGPALVLPPVLRVGSLLAGESRPAIDPAAVPLTILAVSLAAGAAVLFAVVKRVNLRRPRAHAPTWGCGYELPTPRMQYTASSFASPLLLAFREVAGVRVTRTAQSLETHAIDPVMAGVILKFWHAARAAAERLRPIQHGKLSFYLLYIVATVLALLLYLLLAPAP